MGCSFRVQTPARTWVSFPGPEHPRRADLPAPVDWGDDGRLCPRSMLPLQTQMAPDDKTPRSWGGNLTHRTPLSFPWNDTFHPIPHCYSFIAAPRRAQTTVPTHWLPQQIETVGSQSERCDITCALFLNAEILLEDQSKCLKLDWWIQKQTQSTVDHVALASSAFQHTTFWGNDARIYNFKLFWFVAFSTKICKDFRRDVFLNYIIRLRMFDDLWFRAHKCCKSFH